MYGLNSCVFFCDTVVPKRTPTRGNSRDVGLKLVRIFCNTVFSKHAKSQDVRVKLVWLAVSNWKLVEMVGHTVKLYRNFIETSIFFVLLDQYTMQIIGVSSGSGHGYVYSYRCRDSFRPQQTSYILLHWTRSYAVTTPRLQNLFSLVKLSPCHAHTGSK